MLIIADKRLPDEARKSLSAYGDLLLLTTQGIVYDAISGHPDIFFCKIHDTLCVSPGLQDDIYEKLTSSGITYLTGERAAGNKYPASAAYNLAIAGNTAIHNFRITDTKLDAMLSTYKKISVNQGYSRCNVIPLDDGSLITCDAGIHEAVKAHGLNSLFVTSHNIILGGFPNGFIGGCCGIHQKTVFFAGKLSWHPQAKAIEDFIDDAGFTIVELYDGPLFDGGSIIFLP